MVRAIWSMPDGCRFKSYPSNQRIPSALFITVSYLVVYCDWLDYLKLSTKAKLRHRWFLIR
ncbi:MAG: hypothetical protein DRO23_10870 [Thermoprotei archaeon]|nr:MAG: hypothetical protein DRO23_10870 [Thermoprotei archaeon]